MKTLPEQLASAKRELAMRNNAYPKWIAKGSMSKSCAAHEIDCMESIVATLEKMVMLAEVSEEMKRDFKRRSEMETAAQDKAGSDTSLPVEAKRVIPDVIATGKEGPQSTEGSSPSGAAKLETYREEYPEPTRLTHCILCGADILSGTKCVNCEEPVGDLI